MKTKKMIILFSMISTALVAMPCMPVEIEGAEEERERSDSTELKTRKAGPGESARALYYESKRSGLRPAQDPSAILTKLAKIRTATPWRRESPQSSPSTETETSSSKPHCQISPVSVAVIPAKAENALGEERKDPISAHSLEQQNAQSSRKKRSRFYKDDGHCSLDCLCGCLLGGCLEILMALIAYDNNQ